MTPENKRAYHREYYHKNKNNGFTSDWIAAKEKRRQYRLANYERIREQEKRSKEKRREVDREHAREYARRMRKENPKLMRDRTRRSDLKRKYKKTETELFELFSRQGFSCACCGTTNAKWHVDHCHTTKVVRGILCQPCNLMLGHAEDNSAVLRAAADYLEKQPPQENHHG